MLFRKYTFPKSLRGEAFEEWYLILQTKEDIIAYMEKDNKDHFEQWLQTRNLTEDQYNPRQRGLTTLMNIMAESIPVGEYVWPTDLISQLIYKKGMGMFKLFNLAGELRVNEAGGFCDAAGFERMHRCVSIGEVHRNGFGFPTDDAVISTDLLFLENSNTVDINFQSRINYLIEDKKNVFTINNLTSRDSKWVFEMIQNTNSIAIETQAVDLKQVNTFMQIFLAVPKKTIYISTTQREMLENLSDFAACNAKHNIIFLN